jgi:hypothetical protein
VHGHLEPSSVVVSPTPEGEERAAVVDLGLGPPRGLARGLTRTGSVRESLHHVSPEQLDGRGPAARSDQYSLACVLTECLTGRPPFPGRDPLAAVKDHLRTLPPPVSEAGARLPRALDAVLARALAKDPAARFPSCGALVAAAREALAESGSPAGPGAGPGLELAVVGGPAAGLAVPLPPGRTVVGRGAAVDVRLADRLLSREHLRIDVEDGVAVVTDLDSSNGTFVGGRPLRRPVRLDGGDIVEAGGSLLAVRPSGSAGDDLPALLHTPGRAPAPATGVAGLRARVGWARSQGRPRPVVADLAAHGSLAVRADSGRRAALARAILLEVCLRHAATDLTVVAGVPPTADDLWSWLGLLPHARVDREPVDGPHVATDRGSALLLVDRLVAVVRARDRLTRDVVDGRALPLAPVVLAVLDIALVDPARADVVLRRGPAVQVHPVWLAGPGATLPDGVGVVVDVVEPAGDLVLRVPGEQPVTGTADGLAPALARRAAAALSGP